MALTSLHIDPVGPARSKAWLRIMVATAALAGTAALASSAGTRAVALVGVGAVLGATLLLAQFGFTGGWRRLQTTGDRSPLAAQALVVLATLLSLAPALALSDSWSGAWAPVGPSVVFGAFLFGIGMQLGGGCGSGTLWVLGGGDARMIATLAGFIAGAFVGSLHLPQWEAALPMLPPIALADWLGWPGAVALQAAVLISIIVWAGGKIAGRIWIAAGVLALANLAVLALSGRPWSVTWAFALWGAELAEIAGWESAADPVWGSADLQALLAGPLLADAVSATDIGMVSGAAIAAGWVGRAAPAAPRQIGPWIAALIGGLAMGYGARLAYGCTIGAVVSGIASTSVHGWIWLIGGAAGSWLGVKLRASLGLAP